MERYTSSFLASVSFKVYFTFGFLLCRINSHLHVIEGAFSRATWFLKLSGNPNQINGFHCLSKIQLKFNFK